MRLTQKVFQKIDSSLESLIRETESFITNFRNRSTEIEGINFESTFYSLRGQSLAILDYAPKTQFTQQLTEQINKLKFHGVNYPFSEFFGCIKGLREANNQGLLEHAAAYIEANVVSDYMSQAEQLLGEGIPGQYDHVPAAVMAGAVLEDASRRLCLRHNLSFDLLKANGERKTLNPLIDELQRLNWTGPRRVDLRKSQYTRMGRSSDDQQETQVRRSI